MPSPKFTWQEVAEHNKADDLYVSIRGKVPCTRFNGEERKEKKRKKKKVTVDPGTEKKKKAVASSFSFGFLVSCSFSFFLSLLA